MEEKHMSVPTEIRHVTNQDVIQEQSQIQNGMNNANRIISRVFETETLDRPPTRIKHRILTNLYRSGRGAAAAIVDRVTSSIMEAGFSIISSEDTNSADTQSELMSILKGFSFYQRFSKAINYCRIHGRAYILINTGQEIVETTQDGHHKRIIVRTAMEELDTPLPDVRIIMGLTVLSDELDCTNYGDATRDPDLYSFSIGPNNNKINIHRDRLLIFDNEGGTQGDKGYGVIEKAADNIKSLITLLESAERQAKKATIIPWSVEGLADILLTGNERASIQNRIYSMGEQIEHQTVVLLDSNAGETIDVRSSTSLEGIKDILEGFLDHIAIGAGIPVAILRGEMHGLNSTGQAEHQAYAQFINGWREKVLRVPLETFLSLIAGTEIEVEFHPIYQPDPQIIADTRSKNNRYSISSNSRP